MAKGEKFKGSDAQKYRSAGARGPGPGVIGRAKIRAAKDLVGKAGEGTIYGLRNQGASLLGQDYGRKIGDNAGAGAYGMYEMGGEVGGSCRGGGAALRGTKFRGVR